MSYTPGAVHALSGSGSVAVAAPVGLKIALSSIPAGASSMFGPPRSYSGLGHLAVGNADGVLASYALRWAQQIIYPLPDGMTVLQWELDTGTTATVTELAAVPPANSTLAPWDRAGALWNLDTTTATSGALSTTVVGTYTVPAATWLLVGHATVKLQRVTVATATAGIAGRVQINNLRLLVATLYVNAIGAEDTDALDSPLYLPAGTVINQIAFSGDSGGTAVVQHSMSGLLFAA